MNNVKTLCVRRGIEQKELSILVGVSQPTVSDWFNNKKNPSGARLEKLSEILGVSRSIILGYDPLPDEQAQIKAAPPTREDRPEQDEAYEIRMLARAMEQLRPDRQQKAIELMRLLMEEDDEGLDQATRVLYALRDKP